MKLEEAFNFKSALAFSGERDIIFSQLLKLIVEENYQEVGGPEWFEVRNDRELVA